jgi:hypothetical protein
MIPQAIRTKVTNGCLGVRTIGLHCPAPAHQLNSRKSSYRLSPIGGTRPTSDTGGSGMTDCCTTDNRHSVFAPGASA